MNVAVLVWLGDVGFFDLCVNISWITCAISTSTLEVTPVEFHLDLWRHKTRIPNYGAALFA